MSEGSFTFAIADESHQNSNIFGSEAVYVRNDTELVPAPPGSRRHTIYGGVTLDERMCFMAAKKANDMSFIRYLDELWRRFGKSAVVVDNVACHDSRRVWRYLEGNGSLVKLLFLPPYSPFLNLAEWLWRRAGRGYTGGSGGRPRATSCGR